MPLDYLIVFIALTSLSLLNLAFLLIVYLRQNRILNRFKFMLSGKGGESIEDALRENLKTMKDMEKEREEVKLLGESIIRLFPDCLQKLGVVRFKAFPGIGGDQSFALALLDGKNNGVIISSIYGRDDSRVYAKPINEGKSSYNLSSEEEEALKKAIG